MPLVVVESPAKAKKIEEYLGRDYKVIASYGHVRDLPNKDGSVLPDQDFQIAWELESRGANQMRTIASMLEGQDKLILATDPDREGEAISWHVLDVLKTKHKKALGSKPIERVTFNAITKSAVTSAIAAPRQIDQPLVDAYLARRALDYLFGFTLSPVLWRKLPGAKSAGRVQSVALRLVVDREAEIERFIKEEFWTIEAEAKTVNGEQFTARLVTLEGKKLEKFSLNTEALAKAAREVVAKGVYEVSAVEAKPQNRNPAAPFMTSTLQMEASRKLGFNPKRTMSVAQKLYEAGLITYMRTDGIDMAPEAVMATRDAIKKRYGDAYVPDSPRMYKSKAKNAQEAHEAIRPTDPFRHPDDVRAENDERRLYDLIWKRTMACQMSAARVEVTTADILDRETKTGLRATGQVILFDGFLKLYQEGRDDEEDEDGRRLPQMRQGEKVGLGKVDAQQSFTQPPPRYNEATLVKRMEELGIGRPSTYASILSTLTEREYVVADKKVLKPSDIGRMLAAFLANFFPDYVEYNYTAKLEEDLDLVSGDKLAWKDLMRRFWDAFSKTVDGTKELRVADVIDRIDEAMQAQLFPDKGDGVDPRLCPTCHAGRLGLRLGKSGGFIGCSNYPECRYTKPLNAQLGDSESGPRELGNDPETGLPVSLKLGRFGTYVEMPDGEKPRRASLPKGWSASDLTLEQALRLLYLPRIVGPHPEDGENILAGIGRYGPYVQHGKTYANLKNIEEVFEIGMNAAVDRIATKRAGGGFTRGGGGGAQPTRVLGEVDGKPINLMPGRYGPYVAFDGVNASLPKGADEATLTLDAAMALIEARRAAGGGAKKGKRGTKAPAAKKAATKKPAAKKPAAKKATKPK
jgi:DNA topoisomerase I